MPWIMTGSALLAIAVLVGLAAIVALRRRGLDRCLVTYAVEAPRRRAPRKGEPVHALICIGDHYEPRWGDAPSGVARGRVERWVRDYPRLFGAFRDSDGRSPRHTFFYPLEEYEADCLDALAPLCADGHGEVEVHLHHDRDDGPSMRRRMREHLALLDRRHGLIARDKMTGELAYGFIHGNWALDNARPDGRWCGVNDELDVLRETGCYADFTLPSAPSPTQTRKINSLYYAKDDPRRPKSHDWGVDLGAGPPPDDALLLIQGPLLLDWGRRKWGLVPRVENGCIQKGRPPTMERLDLWLKARVQAPSRPDWFFIKLYAHGATESNMPTVLGQPMVDFHEALARRAADDPAFHYHYVTAREMANLARAAEAGWAGPVAEALDYRLVWDARRVAVARAGRQLNHNHNHANSNGVALR